MCPKHAIQNHQVRCMLNEILGPLLIVDVANKSEVGATGTREVVIQSSSEVYFQVYLVFRGVREHADGRFI